MKLVPLLLKGMLVMIKKKIEKHLIVDARNLAYQAAFGMPSLTTISGRASGALYGYLQILRKLIRVEQPDFVLVCWDGRPSYRLALFSAYKQQRIHANIDNVAFTMQLAAMEEFTDCLGISQARHSELEADDIIAAYSRAISALGKKECKAVIASADKDFWQLISSNVVCLHPRTDAVITLPTFFENTGFHSPQEYLEYKVIVGDSSDGIPGLVKGIGDKKARELVKKEFFAKHWKFLKDGIIPNNAIPENAIIDRQYGLIDLTIPIATLALKLGSVFSGTNENHTFQKKVFRELCSRWDFHSIDDDWMFPFQKLLDCSYRRKFFKGRGGLALLKRAAMGGE